MKLFKAREDEKGIDWFDPAKVRNEKSRILEAVSKREFEEVTSVEEAAQKVDVEPEIIQSDLQKDGYCAGFFRQHATDIYVLRWVIVG